MVNWILSVLLYLFTIFIGFYLDYRNEVSRDNRFLKRAYLLWLCLFLCFGYTTGADWIFYEPFYNTSEMNTMLYVTEPASWLTFQYMPKLIPDFWLFLGLAKCAYLYSVYFLLSRITERWLAVIALMIPCQLGFMLIQNPLRFMFGIIFINFSLFYLYRGLTNKEKRVNSFIIIIGLIIIAGLFHNVCFIYLIIIPLLYLAPYVKRINVVVLFLFYILLTIIFSDVDFIVAITGNSVQYVLQHVSIKDYSASYITENNDTLFTIGNLFSIAIFAFILITRNKIVLYSEDGYILYGITVVYCMLSRALVLVPTGFRIPLPLIAFYVIYIIYMFKSDRYLGKVFVLYFVLAFTKKLWNNYDFIPYTNSIPYILTEHLPYTERYDYNATECFERTGNMAEILEDEDYIYEYL